MSVRPPGNRLRLLPLLFVSALAGCNDPAIERGRPPPLLLVSSARSVALGGDDGRLLRGAVAALRATGGGAVRARILTLSNAHAAHALAVLSGAGLEPDRIGRIADPRELVILTRTDATSPDCRGALRPAWSGDVSNSLESLGQCVAAADLAGMVADPADIIQPAPPLPTEGAVVVPAVQALEGVGQAPAAGRPSTPSTVGAGSGSAPAPAAAPANPLLSSSPLAATPE